MKKSLPYFALAAAISAPSAVAAELFGLPVPAVIDASSLSVAFVFALVLMTLFADYPGSRPAIVRPASQPDLAVRRGRCAHPLAA